MSMRTFLKPFVFAAACGLGAACGMGGYVSPGGHDLPNAGLGPFRLLAPTESENGQAILVNGSVDSSMVVQVDETQYMLVYTSALIGERPAEDPTAPWLARYGARTIRRSEPNARPTFVGEIDVLSASAAWEGAEVFDPWMLRLPSGRMRLYYAAEGGIGVAESDTATGTFTRVGDGPVLATDDVDFDTTAPRHPSVIFDGSRYVLYFATQTKVGVAFSADGLTWTDVREAPIEITVPGVDDPEIASFGAPSALWKTPSVGAPYAHIFCEVRLADGTTRLSASGTRDHDTFDTTLIPPIGRGTNPGMPSALGWNDRTTFLYFTVDKTVGGGAGRALYASVSPGNERFEKPMAEN